MEHHILPKPFKYRLIPTPAQAQVLEAVWWRCRELYNAGLEERKAAWEKCGVSVTFAMQSAQRPAITEARPKYHDLNAQVLQDVPLTSIIGGRLAGSLSFLYSGAPRERRCSGWWRP